MFKKKKKSHNRLVAANLHMTISHPLCNTFHTGSTRSKWKVRSRQRSDIAGSFISFTQQTKTSEVIWKIIPSQQVWKTFIVTQQKRWCDVSILVANDPSDPADHRVDVAIAVVNTQLINTWSLSSPSVQDLVASTGELAQLWLSWRNLTVQWQTISIDFKILYLIDFVHHVE